MKFICEIKTKNKEFFKSLNSIIIECKVEMESNKKTGITSLKKYIVFGDDVKEWFAISYDDLRGIISAL